MAFPLRRTLDPIVEPVSLAVMKNYLRVDIDDDDDLISSLISIARERAEDMTGRCLLEQEWTFALDRFPGWGREVIGEFGLWTNRGKHGESMFLGRHLEIVIPRAPVISIESITYLDLTQTLQTLDPSIYEVDLLSEPTRIRPAYNSGWPVALWDTNSVTIKFTSGYQQTVTNELVTLSSTAPFTAELKRGATALSITSAVDATTSTPIVGTLSNGVVTFATGTAGQTINVTYVVTCIPQSFIHAIKLLVGTYYENRAEVVQGGGNFNSFPVPLSAASLLETYNAFPVGYPKG